jgi:hypothetical protein
MSQSKQHKELWILRDEWSTEGNGDTREVKDLIVFNKEQVEEYLKNNYNIEREGIEDYSDGEESFCFSYSAIYDENGNESSEGWDSDKCEVKEGYYEQTDSISAYKDDTMVTESQIQELKNTFRGHIAIDLTED